MYITYRILNRATYHNLSFQNHHLCFYCMPQLLLEYFSTVHFYRPIGQGGKKGLPSHKEAQVKQNKNKKNKQDASEKLLVCLGDNQGQSVISLVNADYSKCLSRGGYGSKAYYLNYVIVGVYKIEDLS